MLSASKAKHIMEQIELDEDERFTSAQIERFKSDPQLYKLFVKAIEEQVSSNFSIVSRFMLLSLWHSTDHPIGLERFGDS